MRRFLVQPDPAGRISGGYLYNQRMAEHAPAGRPLMLIDLSRASTRARDELDALPLAEGDVVLADSLFLHPERIAPFQALRGRGVRLGMLLHSLPSFLERGAAGWATDEPIGSELDLLAYFDFLVVPGPYLGRVLDGATARSIHVCPPGIDSTWRRSEPPPPPLDGGKLVPVLLSAGAITPIKGFDDVVAALARLAGRRSFIWNIAGSTEVDPAHVARLRRGVERAGLAARVRLLGQRSVDETRALFDAADLFVLGSHTENHPLSAMEALASCVPIVAYEVGGMADIVRHGETGLLAPHRDVGVLASHLDRLLGEAGLRHEMALQCWHRRDSLSSWTEAAERLGRALDREQEPREP